MGRFQKTIVLAVTIGIVLFFSGGCEYQDGERLPLESDVTFKIYESHGYHDSIREPKMYISMVTEKEYGYGDYQLIVDKEVRQDKVLLVIAGVWNPDGPGACVIAPAVWSDSMDLVPGEYDLLISYRLQKDKYLLEITDSLIELTPVISIFTDAAFKTYWRYPKNSFVCYAVASEDDTASILPFFKGFVDTLLARLELEEFGFPVYPWDTEVSYPYPLTGWDEHHNIYTKARYFRYKNDSDFEEAGEILETYVQDVVPDTISPYITLKNWRNERYDSDDFR